MKNKLSKLFIVFTMLFTMFAVPKMEVKANVSEVSPYALIAEIPFDLTDSGTKTYGNETINYTVRVYGSYYLNNGQVDNINVSASVSRTPTNLALTAYVKSVSKVVTSSNQLKITVVIGFKYGTLTISGTKIHTFTV